MEKIPDQRLFDIGKGIGNDGEKLLALALQLDFTYADYTNFKATNHSGGRVTSEGTISMLFNWREKTKSSDQAETLSKALKKVGLFHLADTYLRTDNNSAQATSSAPSSTSLSSQFGAITINSDDADGASNRATRTRINENVSQKQLELLSREFPNANFQSLSRELGIGANQADNILVKHCKDYRAATMEILMMWMNRTGAPCSELEEALNSCSAGDLVSKILYK